MFTNEHLQSVGSAWGFDSESNIANQKIMEILSKKIIFIVKEEKESKDRLREFAINISKKIKERVINELP